jgi:integrase
LTNPARKIKKLDESLNRVRFLSEDEEEKLLATGEDPLRAIILIGIYAGLRIQAEALTLKWENIDLERKLLTVEAAYAKNRETETIPMNSRLVEALRALKKSKTGEYVFVQRDGSPYRSTKTAFTTACRHAKLRDVTPHTLRHTFASRRGMSGANDRTLQALGRWNDPKMIQRYTHLSKEHLAEAVERIGSHSTTLFITSKAASS